MTEQLTLRDLEMLQDAVFQRAGDATTEREEDRWLALEPKIAQMGRESRAQACGCGHLRGAHQSRTDVSTCVICRCKSFTPLRGERGPAASVLFSRVAGMTVPDSPVPLRVTERRVPPFTGNGMGYGRPVMNRLQKSFFEKDFMPGFLCGDPVEIGDETRFVTAMFYELVDMLDDDPTGTELIRRLAATYRRGISFPESVIADAYFIDGNFRDGYASLGTHVSWAYCLNLAAPLGYPRLSPLTISRWSEHHITKRGVRGLNDMFTRLDHFLDEFHDVHGMNVMCAFWQRLTDNGDVDDVAQSVAEEVGGSFAMDDIREILTEARAQPKAAPPRAFEWSDAPVPVSWPIEWVDTQPYAPLLFAKCRQLMRTAENEYRAGAGVPLVGQGWVSELTLFRDLEAAFPEERIVHQGRPWWLGRQSLDIYFPDKLVAVEYQGVQHSKPVDHFGGKKAFERQQERDAWKEIACRSNGCELITVHPGYNRADVIETVRAALDRER